MLGDKKVIAWIPARGGSKGIKDKNIIDLCGKPLIAYTIEAALNSKFIDKVMVSTDSVRIAEIARQYGAWVPELRPERLASDTSKTLDAVIYTLGYLSKEGLKYDVFCLLQPTSPCRNTEDIDAALTVFEKNNGQGVVSVSPVDTNPILIRTVDTKGELKRILDLNSTMRRQNMPAYYHVNGSIYINSVENITEDTSFNDNPIPFFMDAERSVDIDEAVDIVVAKYWIERIGRKS